MELSNFNGDDLLKTLSNLNIDLKNLKCNVIRGWFDTDCPATKELLEWMCLSLSSNNYVHLLERAEFNDIENKLDLNKCTEEIASLNPHYLSMLDDCMNLHDITLIENEIELLEEENEDLNTILKIYENVDSNISLEITNKTREEIKTKVDCKSVQDLCQNLCLNLEETNAKLQECLVKYNPDTHFVNFINTTHFHEKIEYLESSLTSIINLDKTILEKSDDHISEELETCKKRILHSYQIFMANKVEIEKLREISEFLNKINLEESNSWNSSATNFEAKQLYYKKLCEVLNSNATQIADHYLKQTRIRYVEQELKELQQRSQNIEKLRELVNKCLGYYTVTNCILLVEKQDVESISNFYQKIHNYINEDLDKCRKRTVQMKSIIDEYNLNLASSRKGNFLLSAIAKVLSCDDLNLKSIAVALGKFKKELNDLESQIFCEDFQNEKKQINKINDDIKILEKFLISGPTNRIVVVPIELQKLWLAVEQHLKKESESLDQALRYPENARKSMTKSQKYTRRLLMSFLTDTSKLASILEQAEADFKSRTKQYF